MKYELKIELIKRLVKSGKVPEAEVACMELGVSRAILDKLLGESK